MAANVGPKSTIRNIIYDKVKGSKLMAFDLHYYEGKEDSHVEKTYKYLIDMISKHIRLRREEKNRDAKNHGLKQLTSRYKSLPVNPRVPNQQKPLRLPRRKLLHHNLRLRQLLLFWLIQKSSPIRKGQGKGGKGKGKGKGKNRERTRSPSVPRTAAEKRKIPCRFYFGSGTTCTKGRDCEYSHSKIPLELTVLQVTGKVYVMHSYKENVPKGRIANMYMIKRPLPL